jgi:beta-lactamase superfamily II metal-dependent hydrolase
MAMIRGLIALVVLLACASPALAQSLKVHFLDVGQGDAVLIQSPSGQNVVYDGGERATEMREHLQALGVSHIDLIVASHNHTDHIGGLADVVRHFSLRFYMDNGIPATTQTYRRLLEAVRASGAQLLEPSARRIALGDVSIVVVPPPGVPGWDQNNNSVGIVVEYGAFRLLLAGDAEPRQWAWWLEHHSALLGSVQVHKASHHGSRNGLTASAITQLASEVVIISVGRGNSYGHPNPETLRLYTDSGATIYRTDLHGTIVVDVLPSGRYTVDVAQGEGVRPPTPTPALEPRRTPQSQARPTASCVNINRADLAELQRIIHIGPARAQQIVELRRARPFASVSELTRVNGIAAARLRDIVAQGIACVGSGRGGGVAAALAPAEKEFRISLAISPGEEEA